METLSLVSTDWLAAHLESPDVRVVDASWYLPQEGRDAKAEYGEQHIPGAVFFDIDEIRDTDSEFPHMLPSAEKFSSRMRGLGLGDGNRIVVYDGDGCMSAARVWWMFRVFGHDDVALLDGGLPKWMAEQRALSDLAETKRERHFTARLDTTMVRDTGQMRENLEDGDAQVVDARPPGRFLGTAPEPRAELPSGHMPGSVNVFFRSLLSPEDRTFLPPEDLRKVFEAAGIDLDRPITTTCGSGVTASVLAFALHLLGHRGTALYDGSWSEWAATEGAPIETQEE